MKLPHLFVPKRKSLLLLILAFVLLLTSARLFWNQYFTSTEQAVAVNGVLDLRQWQADDKTTVKLDGEWEFLPYQWLYASAEHDASPMTASPVPIAVPGSWNALLNPATDSPYGYGSYRLRILTKPDQQITYSIRMASVRSASELYVNGQLLDQSGHPHTSKLTYTPHNVPYIASFPGNGNDMIEIVVQASNFDDPRKSGLIRSIKFGSEHAIHREVIFSITMQLIVAIALLMHAVYAVLLYAMGKRDPKLLYFALTVFSAVLIMLMSSEDKLLRYWVPVDFSWSYRLTPLFIVCCTYSMLRSMLDFMPAVWRKVLHPLFATFCIIVAGLALILPLDNFMPVNSLFLTIVLLMCIAAVASLAQMTWRGVRNNYLLMLCLIAFANNFIWLVISMASGIKVMYYPFDLLVAAFTFSAIWFKRYFIVFNNTEKLAKRLQEEDKRKDEFLATTSHELRNPLHTILNMSQAVLEREQQTLTPRSRKDLQAVMQVGRNMSFTLNELLDMMRLKEHAIRLNPRSISLCTVVTGVADMLHFMCKGKSLEMINQVPAQFPLVWADEQRLMQIIFNLLHNAVKYTNDGQILIRATETNGMAALHVVDTGIGMDEDTVRRIFDPYERGAERHANSEGGFGLGLSICKQLAELQGGSLHVQSTLGAGSIFTCKLPLATGMEAEQPNGTRVTKEETQPMIPTVEMDTDLLPKKPAAAFTLHWPAAVPDADHGTPEPQQPRSANRPRILVVDDDPLNFSVLETILSVEHYELTGATSGKEALAMLERNEWDLLIVDVMMPYMSGYELTRMVRERFSLLELPILLLTARSQSTDIENGFLSGANDYVTKPTDALELRARVRALTLMKQSARDRLRMEAAWLQAQIQPHFLFNTLNTVAALSDLDTERMRKLLETLGHFLRDKYSFRNAEELVPLEYELGIIRSYLYVEQERFDERLQVEWNVEETLAVSLPPLTIQPLVENAVRHGIFPLAKGGVIRIDIRRTGHGVEIAVTDNGAGMDEDKLLLLRNHGSRSSGIGFTNTDLRLKRMYGKGLRIESKKGHGTTVSFVIETADQLAVR